MAYLVAPQPGPAVDGARDNDYGDWLSVDADTPRDVLATAFWPTTRSSWREIAERARTRRRAAHYERLHGDIVAAFNRAFVARGRLIEGDTQTVYLLALHMDLLPDELRARAAERWWPTSSATAGTSRPASSASACSAPCSPRPGYADVAYRLLLNETFPSWGYSIRHGATTIWERWDGWTEERGFQTR